MFLAALLKSFLEVLTNFRPAYVAKGISGWELGMSRWGKVEGGKSILTTVKESSTMKTWKPKHSIVSREVQY